MLIAIIDYMGVPFVSYLLGTVSTAFHLYILQKLIEFYFFQITLDFA